MKNITQKLKTLAAPLLEQGQKHVAIIVTMLFLLSFAFLGVKAYQLAEAEPTQIEVTDRLTTVQRPKVDQSSLEKIQQLQDQNIQVQALFDAARANPFDE